LDALDRDLARRLIAVEILDDTVGLGI